jgi:hypothetical protein
LRWTPVNTLTRLSEGGAWSTPNERALQHLFEIGEDEPVLDAESRKRAEQKRYRIDELLLRLHDPPVS